MGTTGPDGRGGRPRRALVAAATYAAVLLVLLPVRGDARGDLSLVGLSLPWHGAVAPLLIGAAAAVLVWHLDQEWRRRPERWHHR